ncbi:unsaturated glucuronyl hydrolase [Emericellopsis atlantica]|uniref:Unsaturated glucuronyl hydrolase n=1 Tax=Emericellopsis atlantica TaxID=2614577 RepID=A0A9P8CLG9_9HYPO|nr:unsaturated glucuronyl hydrolase [Emericellopsis atlantica]KAG9251624.1 unsaturated glucuronyl hydrolase [Emericellopsis atlantica]
MTSLSSSSSASPYLAPDNPTPSQTTPDSETSWSDSPLLIDRESRNLSAKLQDLHSFLHELFDENLLAKTYRVGVDGLDTVQYTDGVARTPRGFPEIVPQSGPRAGLYDLREPEFWTCGFFPGTLYALLERSIRHPQVSMFREGRWTSRRLYPHLRTLCEAWSDPLHAMSLRTDTHDIGFIVMPALQRDWELTGNRRSLESIVQAARSLASRFVSTSGAIRSWDLLLKKEIAVTDMEDNNLVIIDSLCNLDLLYYAAAHSGDVRLAEIATTHAKTLMDTHLRPESPEPSLTRRYRGQMYSTCHVGNISPKTGALKFRWTAQGYANDSIWARGQAWAILGYAQTYMWTRDSEFLDVACGVAEYFLYRLETAPSSVEMPDRHGRGKTMGRHVPLWDFDAPVNPERPLRDSSAGIIAANGMLILSQALRGVGRHGLSRHFLDASLLIVRDTLDVCLSLDTARFADQSEQEAEGLEVVDSVEGARFDGFLRNGTANNNENARRRYSDHGLVYGDYYLVEFGNRLLNMGLA